MAFHIDGTAGPVTGHNDEVDGFPAGGHVSGVGFHIDWQATPLGDGPERADATGAFVEDVILACIQRVKFYQGDDEDGSGRFRCTENELTIAKLNEAPRHTTRQIPTPDPTSTNPPAPPARQPVSIPSSVPGTNTAPPPTPSRTRDATTHRRPPRQHQPRPGHIRAALWPVRSPDDVIWRFPGSRQFRRFQRPKPAPTTPCRRRNTRIASRRQPLLPSPPQARFLLDSCTITPTTLLPEAFSRLPSTFHAQDTPRCPVFWRPDEPATFLHFLRLVPPDFSTRTRRLFRSEFPD